MSQPTRRSFLKTAVASAAAIGLAGKVRAESPNEEMRLGLVGCGSRGKAFVSRVDYVCDPDQQRLGEAAKLAGVDSGHAVADMRRILDAPDVDAVIIAAPDHWHAPAAILACQAGKHVYLEKPCSHNFRESQLVLAAARQNNVVVQHGTQQRSRQYTIDAIQSLREGIIGDVLVAKAWDVQRRDNIGHAKPTDPPAGVDYDLWVGPAEMVPFQPNRFHKSWHWWYNFGTGDIGNDGAHEIDYARWGLGVDTLPSRVTALGGKYYFDDDQQFPDTATCVFEYRGDGQVGQRRQLIFEMRLWSRNYPQNCDGGVEFYGTKGQMFFSKRGKLIVLNDQNQTVLNERPSDEPPMAHLDDFLDAIRNNRRPNADILEGHRSVGAIHLANVALRVGRSIEFDPQTEQIVGDAEASKLLSRTYRSGGHWAIPKGV
jgi:predicted dehydrogenase